MSNRIIKFRAWNDGEMIYSQDENRQSQSMLSVGDILSRFETIMQFTGLTDKNGIEIYEGDICEGHDDGRGKIVWTEFDGGYDYVFSDEGNVGIWEVKKDLVVIGNIHQHPDLLT